MPDNLKQIKEFSTKPDFGDTDLLLIQGQGTTYNVQGSAVKRYAENAAKPQVELAAQQAQAAADAADRAEAAIVHPPIPDPETGNWMRWDQLTGEYVVTDVRAEGQDFEIRGFYDTFAALQAAVPNPDKGWAYGVGTEPPYEIYIWDAVGNEWKNNGPMTATGDMLKSTYDPQHKAQDVFAYADSVGLPPGGTVGQILVKEADTDRSVKWDDPPEGVGRSMAGQTVNPTKDTSVTAGEGAEIFNDYRPRTFGTDSNPDSAAVREGNIASGAYSHAEGSRSTADGDYAHAEGYGRASGRYSHAEVGGLASGDYAHAEASGTASGKYSHSEGGTASGNSSHSEGSSTKATGTWAHAEGYNTEASGSGAHAEGSYSKATGSYSHAEGANTEAGGSSVYSCAHAEGFHTTASAYYAHSEGYYTVASEVNSHAEGYYTEAKGRYSHAGNSGTIAASYAQTAIGEANVESSSSVDKFIIGKGTFWAPGSSYNTTRSNCFRVSTVGVYASGNYNASGADYAELFEWADGNPNGCDWVGRFVTLDGAKIRLASPLDDYILGIVSGCPSVVGDVYDDQWQGMYLTDIFGRPIMEDVEVPDVTETFPDPEDPENTITRVIIPAHTERRQKLNPDYDTSQLPYIPRTERPEWAAVGLLGKLVALDDGTCVPNGWAAVGQGGVATASEARTKYRVMERLDGTHVRIMIL